ncbi:putative RNA polymerase ECF-type sigma factor [Leptospira ryugenii]|uniref:Putative RNA polymerase ECF-type sigma factor n=1 Tax=Leptospira ryugenii TaxID=1917863 RepID=A0A2P2E4S6_9LEPT|nr:sigma-70 family RNA polymerase sigma factor [Leptospira ryugenii]GBF51881.1 putative RNA polymerase ECF-type sigma factor [Leptospira ryugenii]
MQSHNNFESLVSETKLLVLKTIGETLIDRFDDSTEDIVQEVYFRVYKSLQKGQFRGDSKLSTWIYQIAKNESKRVNAKRIKEEEKAKKYLDSDQFQTLQREESEDLINSFQMEKLLRTVPEPYKLPLKLYLAGKSMEEIANDLAMKQGTVKSRLFRAKEWIRKNLIGELKHET